MDVGTRIIILKGNIDPCVWSNYMFWCSSFFIVPSCVKYDMYIAQCTYVDGRILKYLYKSTMAMARSWKLCTKGLWYDLENYVQNGARDEIMYKKILFSDQHQILVASEHWIPMGVSCSYLHYIGVRVLSWCSSTLLIPRQAHTGGSGI